MVIPNNIHKSCPQNCKSSSGVCQVYHWSDNSIVLESCPLTSK